MVTGGWLLPVYTCIAEDTAASDDGSGDLTGPNKGAGSYFFQMGTVPSDISKVTAVSLRVSEAVNRTTDDTIALYYQIFESDETTALTNEVNFASLDQTNAWSHDTLNMTLVSATNAQASWSGARIRVRQVYTQVSSADTDAYGQVSTATADLTYIRSSVPKLAQSAYVFENDDGTTVNNATARDTGNTAPTAVKSGERITLRDQISNTGGPLTADRSVSLFYDRGDGYWAKTNNSARSVTGAGSCTNTNFSCTTVATANSPGAYSSTAVDANNNPWVVSQSTGNADLQVARYVGAGGSGCAAAAWSCQAIDSTGSVGDSASIAIDLAGNGWVAYHDSTNNQLKVAKSNTSGSGTGCATTDWTCTTVDSSVNAGSVGTSIAIDPYGNPWIAYYDGTNGDLRVAQYVGTGGNCTSSAWSCTTVDPDADSGSYPSIAFDQAGNPWVSYADTAGGNVQVATYVGTGGYNCATTAWTCVQVNNYVSAQQTSIAIGPDGNPWVSYLDYNGFVDVARYVGSGGTGCVSSAWTCTTPTTGASGRWSSIGFDPSGAAWVTSSTSTAIMLSRYVGSGGTGCTGNTAWTCTTLDSSSANVGSYTSLAFDRNGAPVVSYQDVTNGALRVATLNHGGEITVAAGKSGNPGDAITSSHADMTSVSDSSNKADADCSAATTWNNGKWFDSADGQGATIADGTSTSQCTELAWTLDTSHAQGSTTYRFVVAADDGTNPAAGKWRGPASVAVYPSLTTQALTPLRVSKDAQYNLGTACTDINWSCADIEAHSNTGTDGTAMAFGPNGKQWIAYTGGNYLNMASYVGGGASDTSCGSGVSQDYYCYNIEILNGGNNVRRPAIAIDAAGTPWVSYYADSGYVRVAHYVGSGGVGCAGGSTIWTCQDIGLFAYNPGYSAQIAISSSGMPAVALTPGAMSGGRIKYATYVGSGGTGCIDSSWNCVDIDDSGMEGSLAFDQNGSPWMAYRRVSGGGMWVAHYVGSGGSGCNFTTSWSCTQVWGGTTYPDYETIVVDGNNTPWVAFQHDGDKDLYVAHYVGGTSGTGCSGSTAWTCTQIDGASTATGYELQMSVDNTGAPWIGYLTTGAADIYVARYVGTGGTGCSSTSAWSCTDTDASPVCCDFVSLAFDPSGSAWMAYANASNGYLRVAKTNLPVTPLSAVGPATAFPSRNARGGDLRYPLDAGTSPSGTCAGTANAQGYCGIAANDSAYDSMTAVAREAPVYAWSSKSATNSTLPSFSWTGQSSVAASTKNLVMQVYQFGTVNAWTTLTTNSTLAANTDGTVTGAATGTASDYYQSVNGSYYTYYRISQAANTTSETLKTNYIASNATNTAPTTPSALAQYKSNGTTSIGTGAWTGQTTVVLKATVSDPDGDAVQLCVEVAATLTNPASPSTCGTAVASGSTASVTVTGLTSGTTYKWQAKAKDANAAYSAAYTQFNSGGSAFAVDTAAPTTGTIYDGSSAAVDTAFNSGSLSSLSCNWSGFADSLSGIASYTYSFGSSAGATDILAATSNGASTTATATGLVVHTSQLYFCNVTATDNVGNASTAVSSNGQMVAPTLTFTVGSSSLTFAALSAGNSYTDSQSVNMTTSTNAYGAYAVRAYQPSLMAYGSNTIPAYAGTWATPTTWTGTGLGYTSSDTSVQGSNRFNTASKYAGFASSGPGDVVADNSTSVTGTAISAEVVTLTIKVAVPPTQSAGTYTGSLLLSCTATY